MIKETLHQPLLCFLWLERLSKAAAASRRELEKELRKCARMADELDDLKFDAELEGFDFPNTTSCCIERFQNAFTICSLNLPCHNIYIFYHILP